MTTTSTISTYFERVVSPQIWDTLGIVSGLLLLGVAIVLASFDAVRRGAT